MKDRAPPGGFMTIDRRHALQLAGATALAGIAPAFSARAASRGIKIGYVTPTTGPLSPMGETDDYVLKLIRDYLKDGVANPAGKVAVEILVKDSQSNPNRAAEVAGELILQDNIDLMVVGATPENSNPVCDQCELNGVPCISTIAPWQPWFFGRGGDPTKGFDWTYHYFWGLEDIIEVFTSIWKQVPTNKRSSDFPANDGDGNAWGDPKLGLPPASKARASQWSIRAASSLSSRTTARRSPPTRRPMSRSSPACRHRPTSRISGPRRDSRASSRRS